MRVNIKIDTDNPRNARVSMNGKRVGYLQVVNLKVDIPKDEIVLQLGGLEVAPGGKAVFSGQGCLSFTQEVRGTFSKGFQRNSVIACERAFKNHLED